VRNPFIPVPKAAPVEERTEPDELWGDQISLSGPSSPAVAPPVDVSRDGTWPTTQILSRPDVCVMGLHGGSGATLLTGLLGPTALDVGRAWPLLADAGEASAPVPVIACARTHHQGLEAAARFARLWAADTLHSSRLLGIVLIDDGPKLSQTQRQVTRRVAQMTPHGWHLTWNESWRLSRPSLEGSPKRVRRIIQNIRTIAAITNGAPK
jgi:hypothetical protein